MNFILLYWNQTNLIQIWNVILDVYQSRDKSLIEIIIPVEVNQASRATYEEPLTEKMTVIVI
jgi:hypothetical protein